MVHQYNANLTTKLAGIIEHQNDVLVTIALQVQKLLSIMHQNMVHLQKNECINETFDPLILISISPTPPSSKHQNRSKSMAIMMIE